jgi:hypothetical protein
MKKQSIQHSNATEINKNKNSASTKNKDRNNKSRYIYTENDLGVGILELSVVTTNLFSQHNRFNQQNNSRA